MSDPLKNMEIEDVLSSIRRLVADETSARPALTRAPAAAPKAEKLVLTAALRVPEKQPEAAVEDETSETSETSEAVEMADVLELEEEADEAVAEAAPTSEADVWEEVSLEDRIAELEAAVSDCEDDWEPDGSEVKQRAVSFEDLEAEERAAPVEEAKAAPAEDEVAATPEPQVEEAAVASGEEDSEESLFDDESDVLDEEMLRQLVSDIVREELQGALGERITRNVRKLVRREINRALASRDFE